MLAKKIDKLVEKYTLLKHPFYRMWTAGTLPLEALQGYAKDYYHVVKAVPKMTASLYSDNHTPEIKMNLEDEKSHVALWEQFADGIGVSKKELKSHKPSSKVKKAVKTMETLMENKHGAVAAMYAFEVDIPNVSKSKIDGLKKHFGIKDAETLEYFTEHERADVYHSMVWRNIMQNFPAKEAKQCLEDSEKCLKAQNEVLDSIYEEYVPASLMVDCSR
jgi:pyrroloquinoline-quinone synthase